MDGLLMQYTNSLRSYEEDLMKLEQCKTALEIKEQEFQRELALVKSPPVSLDNFRGELATGFYTIRDVELYESYQEITTNQFAYNFEVLDKQIVSLKASIEATKQSIVLRQAIVEKKLT